MTLYWKIIATILISIFLKKSGFSLLPTEPYPSFIPTILQAARDKDLFSYEKKAFSEWLTIDFENYDAVIIEGFTNFPEGLNNRLRQFHQNQKGLI